MFRRWKKRFVILALGSASLGVFAHAAFGANGPKKDAEDKSDPHAILMANAMQLFREGKYHEAEVSFRTLLANDEKIHGLDHADTLQDRKNLAIVMGVEGDYLGAEKVLHDAIDLEAGVLGAENKDVLEFREILASTLAREGRPTEAVHEFREVLAIRERVSGPGDPSVARAKSNLGSTLVDQGEYSEAERLLRQAQPVLETKLGPNDAGALLNRTNLCKALLGMNRFFEAEKEQRALLEMLQHVLPAGHPEIALARLNLAATLRAEGKNPEALELARTARNSLVAVMGADQPKVKEAQQMVHDLEKATLTQKATRVPDDAVAFHAADDGSEALMISLSPVTRFGNEWRPMSRRRSPRAPVILLLLAFGSLISGCGKQSGPSPDSQVETLQLRAELDRTKNKLAAAEKEIAAKNDAIALGKEETEGVKKQVTEKGGAIAERESQIRVLQGQIAAMKKSDVFVFVEASKLVQGGMTTSALGRYQQFVKDFPKSPLVTDANRAIAELGVTAPRDAKARAAAADPKAPERDLLKKFTDGLGTPQELAPLLKAKSLVEVLRLLGAPNRTYRDGKELGYVDKVTDPATGERATLIISFDEGQTVSTLRAGYAGRPFKP